MRRVSDQTLLQLIVLFGLFSLFVGTKVATTQGDPRAFRRAA